MKKSLIGFVVCLGAACVFAAPKWQAGQGIANDHASGKNDHDVTFVQRGGGAPYGYRAYDTAIGLTFLPWSAPNFESTVKGVRFNFGWGSYDGTYGFDCGVFSSSGDFGGIAIDWFGSYAECDAAGIQIGLANVVGGTAHGLQIGLVNHVHHLNGVQIGLLNFATSQWTLPIINVAW